MLRLAGIRHNHSCHTPAPETHPDERTDLPPWARDHAENERPETVQSHGLCGPPAVFRPMPTASRRPSQAIL